MVNRSFEQLWNEAYIAYLLLRSKCGIPLTNEQRELIKNPNLTESQKKWVRHYGGNGNNEH